VRKLFLPFLLLLGIGLLYPTGAVAQSCASSVVLDTFYCTPTYDDIDPTQIASCSWTRGDNPQPKRFDCDTSTCRTTNIYCHSDDPNSCTKAVCSSNDISSVNCSKKTYPGEDGIEGNDDDKEYCLGDPRSCSPGECGLSGGDGGSGGSGACGGASPECVCEENCSAANNTGESCDKAACTGVMCCPSGGGGGKVACQPIPSKREDCSTESNTKCKGYREADAGKCDPGYACRQTGNQVGDDDLIVCGCQWDPACNQCNASQPAPITLLSPANGSNVGTTTVTLTWQGIASWGDDCNPSANTKQYNVYVGTDSGASTLVATVASNITSYQFTGSAGQLYYWKVQASNGAKTRTSDVWSFYTSSTIAGTVYYDPNNTCSTSNPSSVGGTTVTERVTGRSTNVAANGTYTITNVPEAQNAYTLDLGYDTGSYVCSTGPIGVGCGAGCPTQTSVTASSTGNNFFLTTKRASWWQTEGAGVYAGSQGGGTTIQSLIPDTISASSRYLVLAPEDGSDSIVVRGSGSTALGSGAVSSSGLAAQSLYRGRTYGYQFWRGQFGVGLDPSNDFLSDSLSKPSYDPLKVFYYQEPVSGTATLDSSWDVASGESYVVFVNGNLTIAGDVNVDQGGFLAFVVSGNVTVDPGVAQIEGIYISDGNFVTQSAYVPNSVDDIALRAEGTVVAWGTLDLNRDLGIGNANAPAELFVYRPDLIVNMPEKMKSFLVRWQEVPAGTFGE